MRRTKEEARETRLRILESALDIFSEKCYSNASLTEIAEHVGLSKGALYWHFKNKNDLLLQLIETLCRGNERNLESIMQNPEDAHKLKNYFMTELTRPLTDNRYQKIHRLMQRRNEWPEEIQLKVRAMVADSIARDKKMVKTLIERGQKEGTIRKDLSSEAVAVLFSSIFHGLCVMQLSGLLPKEFPGYTDILFDAMTRELATKI
ncbi:MAG: TetR family transcriptional regulator [Cloacibacillus sp.]